MQGSRTAAFLSPGSPFQPHVGTGSAIFNIASKEQGFWFFSPPINILSVLIP